MIASSSAGSGSSRTNLYMYRKKTEPIIIPNDDFLQYDVPAAAIDKGEEVVNKRYADANLVQKSSVVASDSSVSDDNTIPTTKAVDTRIASSTSSISGKVSAVDGTASKLTVSSGGVNGSTALSIKDYGSSKGWGIQTTPASDIACQIWRFNDTNGAYRASMSQAGQNVTIDNFLRLSLSGFGFGIDYAITTKPANASDCCIWDIRNNVGTSIASIWQADNVARLVGFSTNMLKVINYGTNLSEGISFTPSNLTNGVSAIRFNDTAGTSKSAIAQRTDGSIRISGCHGIDFSGYSASTMAGLSMLPANTTGVYSLKIHNAAGGYIGGIWQDGDIVTFDTTKIKLKSDASAVDSFATTLNTSTTAIPRCSAVSTALASYAQLAGATFTSQVNVPTLKLTGTTPAITAINSTMSGTPSNSSLLTESAVSTALSSYAPLAGATFSAQVTVPSIKLTGSPSIISAVNSSMSATPSNSSLLTELGVDTMVKTYCGNFVSDAGDTMTGQLVLPSMKLNGTIVDSVSSTVNTSTSSIPTCAAVSAAINSGTFLPTAGGTMTGNLTTPSLTMGGTLITAITTTDSSDPAALTTTEAAYDIADGWKTCPITGIIDCCTSYNGDVIFIHNGTKVYLSIDGGDSWSLGATLPSIRRIYCDNTAGVLLVVTYEDKAATMYYSLWYFIRNGSVLSTGLSGGYLFSSKALAATSFNPTSGILRLTAAGYMRSYTVSSAAVVTPISSADDTAPFNSIVMNDSSNTHLFTAPTGCFYATDNGQNLTSTAYIVPDGNLMVIGDSDLTHVYTYSTTGTKLYVSNNRLTSGTEIYNSPYGVINTACVANGRIYMITGSRLIVSYDCGATFEVVKTFVGAQSTYNFIKVVPKTGTIICSSKNTISWRRQSLYKNDLAPINLKAGYVFNRTVPTPILLPPPESWNFLEFNWTFMMSPPSVFTPVARVFVPMYSSMHIELRGIVKQHPTTVATSQYIVRRFYDFYRHDGAVTMTEINFADKSLPGTGGVAHPTCIVDGFYLNIGTYAYTMTTDVVVHTKIYKIQGFN